MRPLISPLTFLSYIRVQRYEGASSHSARRGLPHWDIYVVYLLQYKVVSRLFSYLIHLIISCFLNCFYYFCLYGSLLFRGDIHFCLPIWPLLVIYFSFSFSYHYPSSFPSSSPSLFLSSSSLSLSFLFYCPHFLYFFPYRFIPLFLVTCQYSIIYPFLTSHYSAG